MDKISISKKNFKLIIKKILWFLARNAFVIILILALSSVAIAEFLFYNYTLLTEVEESNIKSGIVRFDSKAYNLVMEELDRKEEIVNKVLETNYKNPFYKEKVK